MRATLGHTALLALALCGLGVIACGPAQNDVIDDGPGPKQPGTGGQAGAGGEPVGGSGGAGGASTTGDLTALEPNQPLTETLNTGGPPQAPTTACTGYDPNGYMHEFDFTVADSGSMAAATRTRELLAAGHKPLPTSIRTSDFLNYYAPTGVNLAPVNGLLAKLELKQRVIDQVIIPSQFDLFVGVQAGPVTRPRVVLTLLVDATLTDEALARAKAVVAALGKGLVAGDHVTLMSADTTQQVYEVDLVDPTTELSELANKLQVGTGTIGQRIADAVQKATEVNKPGDWNRVVVLGDGEENPDAVDYTLIETTALSSKIYLTAVGLSPESTYGDYLLHRLSRSGRGRYVYVDGVTEADALFPARFDELFGVARENVRVQVQLPWYMHSLEPEMPASTSNHSEYLAPGGVMRFVFRVSVCSPTITTDEGFQLINLKITSNEPDGISAPDVPFAKKVKELLGAPAGAPELAKVLATHAFIDALRYPVASRFTEADALLAQYSASPFTDMLALLGQHPNHPNP